MQMKGRLPGPGVMAVEALAVGEVADTVAGMATGEFAQVVAAGQPGVCQTDDGDAGMAGQARAQRRAHEKNVIPSSRRA